MDEFEVSNTFQAWIVKYIKKVTIPNLKQSFLNRLLKCKAKKTQQKIHRKLNNVKNKSYE